MDVVADVAAVSLPVAVITAAEDNVVPPRRSDPVRRAADDLVMDRRIAGVGHNTIHGHADYRRAMQEAISLIEAR